MENVGRLVKTSIVEIERLLSTKSMVEEPMSVERNFALTCIIEVTSFRTPLADRDIEWLIRY